MNRPLTKTPHAARYSKVGERSTIGLPGGSNAADIGVGRLNIPYRLYSGPGITATYAGTGVALELDLATVPVGDSTLAEDRWVPMWDESSGETRKLKMLGGGIVAPHIHPISDVTDLQATLDIKLEDAPSDDLTYARRNGTWDAIVTETIEWGDIVGIPSNIAYKPVPQDDITDLTADLNAIRSSISTNAADIDAVEAVNTAQNTSINNNALAISTETTNRADADSTLQTNINAEASTRAAADTTLQTNINGKLALPPTTPAQNWNAKSDGTWVKDPIQSDAPDDGFQYARKGDGTWAKVTGGAIISDTPPAGALPASFWWESDTGGLYIRYEDATPNAQWVQVNTPGLADAPQNAMAHVRTDGTWQSGGNFSQLCGFNAGISVGGAGLDVVASGARIAGGLVVQTGGASIAGALTATGSITATGGFVSAGPVVFSHISNFQLGYAGAANLTTGTGVFHIAFAGTNRFSFQPTSGFRPMDDATHVLGGSSQRWTTVYATSGTISTSDENEKQDIRPLEEAELRVARALKPLIVAYRWRDRVEAKGDTDARIHIGIIAQRVQEAFAAEGLDAAMYGLWCEDEIEEYVQPIIEEDENGNARTVEEGYMRKTGGVRLGVRYDELAMFILAGM